LPVRLISDLGPSIARETGFTTKRLLVCSLNAH